MCTWVGCQEEAKHKQVDQTGNVWADLCDLHDNELKLACKSSIPKMVSAWVKAQGGSKKTADKMVK